MVTKQKRKPRALFEDDDDPDDPQDVELSRVVQWVADVIDVLEKPIIAITLFVLGVFFIVLASKQVKLIFEVVERLGLADHPRDGFLGNFMVIFVFLFVWVDIVLLTMLRKWGISAVNAGHRWYMKIMDALEDIEAKEEMQSTLCRRGHRRRKR